jgi:hypothetical protein
VRRWGQWEYESVGLRLEEEDAINAKGNSITIQKCGMNSQISKSFKRVSELSQLVLILTKVNQ